MQTNVWWPALICKSTSSPEDLFSLASIASTLKSLAYKIRIPLFYVAHVIGNTNLFKHLRQAQWPHWLVSDSVEERLLVPGCADCQGLVVIVAPILDKVSVSWVSLFLYLAVPEGWWDLCHWNSSAHSHSWVSGFGPSSAKAASVWVVTSCRRGRSRRHGYKQVICSNSWLYTFCGLQFIYRYAKARAFI